MRDLKKGDLPTPRRFQPDEVIYPVGYSVGAAVYADGTEHIALIMHMERNPDGEKIVVAVPKEFALVLADQLELSANRKHPVPDGY